MSEQTSHIIPNRNYRLKVCGMTTYDQVMSLDEMGVVFAGFIFYAPSPRYCLRFTDLSAVKKIRGKNINKVGVFVNASAEEVLRTVDEAGLSMVQLHGEESPRTCERIAEYVSVIKAFRLREDDQVLWKIKDYQPLVDMILFDTATSTYGGSGKKFDWELLRGLKIGKPFFLSGGIGPEDVQRIHDFSRDTVAADLFAIDINSRFETSPGIKDLSLVRQFMQELNHF